MSKSFQAGLTCGSKGVEPEEEVEEEPKGAEEEQEPEPSTGVTLKHSRNGSPSPGVRPASPFFSFEHIYISKRHVNACIMCG